MAFVRTVLIITALLLGWAVLRSEGMARPVPMPVPAVQVQTSQPAP